MSSCLVFLSLAILNLMPFNRSMQFFLSLLCLFHRWQIAHENPWATLRTKQKTFFFLFHFSIWENVHISRTVNNTKYGDESLRFVFFSPVRYFVLHWMLFLCAVVIFWYFNIFFSLLRSIVPKESDDSSFCNIRGMPVERAKNSNSFVRCFFFLLSSASRLAGNFIPYISNRELKWDRK